MAIRWLGGHASVVVWDSVEDAVIIHGHQGRTELVWDEDHEWIEMTILDDPQRRFYCNHCGQTRLVPYDQLVP